MAELEIKPTAAARIRVFGTMAVAGAICAVLIFLLTGGGRNFFEEKATLSTYMPDVTGLAIQSDVRLSGIPIGSVTHIDISGSPEPQRAVRVEMRVSARFLRDIPQDSQTSIGADTLIGYKFVSIAEGKSIVSLAAGATLRSEPLQLADNRADLVKALQTELHQVDDLLVQMSSPDTPIGQFVTGDAEYNKVLSQIVSFDQGVRSFVAPDNPAGQALFSDKLYNRIRTPLLNVDNQLAAIERGEGAAGHLFASDDQYNDLVRQLKGIHASLAAVKPDDGAAYGKIRKMLAETDALISSLNAGEGQAGQLLRNPQLYESLNGSLSGLQALLKDLREHPQKYLRYKVF